MRTGLQLAAGAGQTTRTWIVYNKPVVPSYTHAGMLMGLGLTGMPFFYILCLEFLEGKNLQQDSGAHSLLYTTILQL